MYKPNKIRSLFSVMLLLMILIVISTADGFELGKDIGVGNNPSSISSGDFNGDNKQDLVAANFYDNTVSILLGNGDGSFQIPAKFSVGTNPRFIRPADLNADGKIDLVVANSGSSNVSVLMGKGNNGIFNPAINYPAGAKTLTLPKYLTAIVTIFPMLSFPITAAIPSPVYVERVTAAFGHLYLFR